MTITASITNSSVDELNQQAWELRSSYPSRSLELSSHALTIAQQIGYRKGEGDAYSNKGTAYYLLSSYENAISELHNASQIFKEIRDEKSLATVIRMQGNIHHSIDQDDQAIAFYEEALVICKRISDKQGIAYNYGNIGYVLSKSKRYTEAIEKILLTLDMVIEMNDFLGLADAENNIAKCYFHTGNKKKAFNYWYSSLEHSRAINHLRGMANACSNIAHYYSDIAEYDKAVSFQQDALLHAETMGEKLLISDILKSISETYEKTGDFRNALDHLKKYEMVKSDLLKTKYKNALNAAEISYQLEQSEQEKELYRLKNVELERLSIVASKTDNAIIIADSAGVIEWINDAGIRINGYSDELLRRFIGSNIMDFSTNDQLREIVSECIRSKQTRVYESAGLNATGKKRYVQTTLTPVLDENENIRKLVFIDSDITLQKQAQEIINQKNKDITDSINYAKRIQEAILPSESDLNQFFNDSFVLYKPKDIVSGDFYWFSQVGDHFIFACADCTGHGVPGALMSMMCNNILFQVINDKKIVSAAQALYEVDDKMKVLLHHGAGDQKTNDGMDIALCIFSLENNKLLFTGANRPLWLIRNNELTEFSPCKFSLGGGTDGKIFNEQEITVHKDDLIYLFSDGYADQFGNPSEASSGGKKSSGKKFKTSNLKKLLLSVAHLSMENQLGIINDEFEKWKGDLEQLDDICMIGVRI